MEEYGSIKEKEEGLEPYLSPLGAWSLAVGTAIGWGSFVFSSNMYLSEAGPMGSALGMLAGMVIMLFISRNYHYLMNRYPAAGGVYTYVKKIFGYDRAFLSFWFLGLAYLSMLWANATSVPLFFRSFFGDVFRVGYLYTIFNYEIYLGELLLTMGVILLTGLLCMKRERHAVRLMALLVLVFVVGISVCFITAVMKRDLGANPIEPAFIQDKDALSQVIGIALISPWAFIGFENISHSAREFAFDRKKSFLVLGAAVVTTTLLYIFVTTLSVTAFPPEYGSWVEYLKDLNNIEGLKGMPAFYAAGYYLGDAGIYLLAASLLALVVTSLIGNTVALSRLFYHVAKDEVLPDRYAELNRRRNPERAVELIMIMSLPIPLLGRTAVGWIVDVTVISAIIVYGLVSAAAYTLAREEGRHLERFTGAMGMAVMILFAILQLFPELYNFDTLETETYFLITIWSVCGFLFLRNVLHRDYARNFGRSVVAWIALMAIITFMSLSWMRHMNQNYVDESVNNIRSFYKGNGPSESYVMGEDAYLNKVKKGVIENSMHNNSLVLLLILFALGMFFSNYTIVQRRSEETEAELGYTKALAFKDAMTGVKSKLAYAEMTHRMDQMILDKTAGQFAVVACDVNGLKHINDTYGHKAGDEYIRSASRLICEFFKHSPVFRTGGDEFVAVLEGHDYENRKAIIEEMDKRVESNIASGGVVVSARFADFDTENDKYYHDVFERADALMYVRKKQLKGLGAKTRE